MSDDLANRPLAYGTTCRVPCNHDWIQANMPGYQQCIFCGTERTCPAPPPLPAVQPDAEHQDWEKVRARASSWNAGSVLEGLMLAIDTDGDAYVLPSNTEGNLVSLPARDDNGEILNPGIWQAMVFRFNAYPALTAKVDSLLGVIEYQAKLFDAITKEKELLEIEKDLLQRELVIANADCDKLRREILHDSWPCWVERPSSKTGGAP